MTDFLEYFESGTKTLPRSAELLTEVTEHGRIPEGIVKAWRDAADSLSDSQLNQLWLALGEAKKLSHEDLPEPLVDLIAPLVEWHHPDKVKQILGKTKLIYVRDRRKHHDFLITEEVKPFLHVFFTYDRRVSPVVLLCLNRDEKWLPKSLSGFFNFDRVPETFELFLDGTLAGATAGPASPAAASGKCFIATAAYGTADAEEVKFLRQLRDNVLLQCFPGRAFVAAYERVSPPIADRLSRSDTLRGLVRRCFLRPLVKSVRMVYKS